jgi:hypothetical protein
MGFIPEVVRRSELDLNLRTIPWLPVDVVSNPGGNQWRGADWTITFDGSEYQLTTTAGARTSSP